MNDRKTISISLPLQIYTMLSEKARDYGVKPVRYAKIVVFDAALGNKTIPPRACIFCGSTEKTQELLGKFVCEDCLRKVGKRAYRIMASHCVICGSFKRGGTLPVCVDCISKIRGDVDVERSDNSNPEE